jgi:hypothetical protein
MKSIHISREDLRGIWSKAKNRILLTNVLCKEPILRYFIALGALHYILVKLTEYIYF